MDTKCPNCQVIDPDNAHLIREYTAMMSARFGVYKRNAIEAQDAIAALLLARGVTHIPNIFGDIPIEREQEAAPVVRLDTPQPCSAAPCTNMAHWRYLPAPGNGAVCYPCMRRMSSMNSDNEEVFAVALREAGQEVQA